MDAIPDWKYSAGFKSCLSEAFLSNDVRRHRLMSVSYIALLPCHGRGRGFESRRPRHSFQTTISRWIHIVFAIPILGYIYSPFEKLPDYAPATRFVFLPVMVLTGLWMWKGHVLRRLISTKKDRPSNSQMLSRPEVRGTLEPGFGLRGPRVHPLVTQPRTPESNPFHL